MAIKNPDGTTTYSNTYNGMVTTTTVDSSGRVVSKETTPYEKTSYTREDGTIVTQESPYSVSYKKPATKTTTATTKDGQTYTFEGDNWINYANANGLDVGSLATALTYPSYVNANEANRYLNEMADTYGVDLSNPLSAYENAVSQQYALQNNVIPDYNTPFASAAAGQTVTNLNANGVPATSTNVGNALSYYGIEAPEYQQFDYSGYFDQASNNYKDSVEAQRAAALKQYTDAANAANLQYDQAAQQAYLSNKLANRNTQRQLLESGVKSGLTESSLLQGNANFENAYNQNEAARINALNNIALQQAQTNAQFDADINAYLAQLALNEANFAQNEIAAMNSYNWNNYLTAIEQQNAAWERAQAQKEYEYQQLQNEIALAYELGDVERLKALGYDTTRLEAQLKTETDKAYRTSDKDKEKETETTEIPTFTMSNGTNVAYVNGRAYNAAKVEQWINEGKIYEKNGQLYSYAAL